jgi:DNA-binding CsgD family transcriptional regulator
VTKIDKEEWRTIQRFPSYQVSNQGRIQNKLTGTLKSPTRAATGFYVVNLSVAGKSNVRNVHSLVAEAFNGPRPATHMVCHLDGDQANCAAANLHYVPMSRKSRGRARDGGKDTPVKLTATKAAEIRRRAVSGEQGRMLAAEFGVSTPQISRIKHGLKWRTAEDVAQRQFTLHDLSIAILDPNPDRLAVVAATLAPVVKSVKAVVDLTSELVSASAESLFIVHAGLADDLQKESRNVGGWRPFVVYCEAPQPGSIVDAVTAGALDYFAWPCQIDNILSRMKMWPSRAVDLEKRHLRSFMARSRVSQLTRREKEILYLLADGLSSIEISEALGLSGRTAEHHRYNILKKLQVTSSVMAVRIAVEAELDFLSASDL